MIDPGYCQTFAAYNAWMNEKLYACAAQLCDEERKRDRGAFFRSLHSTFNHLLWADRVWLGRFNGRIYDVGAIGVDLCDDFDHLCSLASRWTPTSPRGRSRSRATLPVASCSATTTRSETSAANAPRRSARTAARVRRAGAACGG